MKYFLEQLVKLLKVKSIISLVVISVFAVLALTGVLPADSVMIVITMVVSFYFGTTYEKNNGGKNE